MLSNIYKTAFLLLVFALYSYQIFSKDMSKFKYSPDVFDKYYKILSKQNLSRWELQNKKEEMFIRDEVKKLKEMNLELNDLIDIIKEDSLWYGTRVAAIRVIIKRNDKEVISKLKDLMDLLEKRRIEENISSSLITSPDVYMGLWIHLSRAIVEIGIKGMNCSERIRYLFEQFGDRYQSSGAANILPYHLDMCSKDEILINSIRDLYNDADNKTKGAIIYSLPLINIQMAKEYIDIGLKSNDYDILSGAMYACWTIYKIDCVKKLELIINDSSKDKVLRDKAKNIAKEILDGNLYRPYERLYREPLNYGE